MKLEAKSINLRLVDIDDAEFILGLRLDDHYNKYLSAVSPEITAQRVWIKKYKELELAGQEYYFIIERKDGVKCGTVRIYDLKNNSFSWGSWILNEDKTRFSALESAFLVYEFGFEKLGFAKSHFEVVKGNEKVISFHEKMGATLISEDEIHFYYEITKEAVTAKKNMYLGKLI